MAAVENQLTSRSTVLMYAHPSMESLAHSIVTICSESGSAQRSSYDGKKVPLTNIPRSTSVSTHVYAPNEIMSVGL